jgi:hypothetical protein
MMGEVLKASETFQIADLIVRAIIVPMMDVHALRWRPVVMLPDHDMKSFAFPLIIATAFVIPDTKELLDRIADDCD